MDSKDVNLSTVLEILNLTLTHRRNRQNQSAAVDQAHYYYYDS